MAVPRKVVDTAWREALWMPSGTQAECGGGTQPQVDPKAIFGGCFQLWWTQVGKMAEARCTEHQINSIKAEKENPESCWLQLQGYDIANILRPKVSLKTYFRRKTWENKSLDLRQQPLPCQPRKGRLKIRQTECASGELKRERVKHTLGFCSE